MVILKSSFSSYISFTPDLYSFLLPKLTDAIRKKKAELSTPDKKISKSSKEEEKKGIETWTLADINLKPEWVGLKGSPTIVKSMRTINEKKREGKKFGVDEMDKFVDELVSKEILKFGGE